ncbi:MAG: hypothetical protein Q4D98_04130 [Planctomycetia bacterium]|nr:hypothetical protein [Planctomycetia bacterium]
MKKVCFLVFLGLATLVSQAADKVVVLAKMAPVPSFCESFVDLAETYGKNGVQGAAYAMKIFTEQPTFTDAWDVSRPVALVGILPEGSDELRGILVLPLKNLDAVNRMVSKDLKSEEVGEQTWKVTSKHHNFFARKLGDWFLLSDRVENLRLNLDVAQVEKRILEPMGTQELSVSLFVNEIPQNLREKLARDIQTKILACLEKQKKQGSQAFVETLKGLFDQAMNRAKAASFVSPADTLTLVLDEDPTTHTLALRLEATAPEGSAAARKLSAFARSQVSSLGQFAMEDAMFSCQLALTFPALSKNWVKSLHEAHLKDSLAMLKKKVKSAEKADQVEAFIHRNAPLWRDAFLAPYVNGGLNVVLTDDDALILWGRTVPDGYALEEPFRQIVQYVKENKAEECKKHFLSTAASVEGEWHVYEAVLAPVEKCPLPFFRDKACPTCLLFAPKGVYFAMGKDARGRLEAYLKSERAKPAEVPAFQAKWSVARLVRAIQTYSPCEAQRDAMARFSKEHPALANTNLTFSILPVPNGAALELKAGP